ncbi:MAG: hypothetical protein LBE83_09520 [Propionibacteriaceae bacterium]|jgi:hypothetical protein|nr:hypothetical protein [Propionibacteriaceae bacterium]
MSVVVLTSASGAPGVTTTTLGLAYTWPRPVIAIEADPIGGSAMLAGFFKGFQTPGQGIVDLLLAQRAGRLAEQFPTTLIGIKSTNAAVLPGPRSHAQAHSALDLWGQLGLVWRTLGNTGTDVLVDAGRLGMESYPEALLGTADLVLLVTRSNLPALAAAQQWTERALQTRELHPEAPEWALLVVDPGHPYDNREIATTLGLPVLSTLGLDPRRAAFFSHGGTKFRRRSALGRDLDRVGRDIRAKLASIRELLDPKEAK